MTSPAKINAPQRPPYTVAGVAALAVGALILGLVYGQFRGDFTPKARLTLLASRSGLVMDPGAKVIYNGVEIGRVATIAPVVRDGKPAAKFALDVYPRYLALIPANVYGCFRGALIFAGDVMAATP